MKVIKVFEDNERLVRLIFCESDKAHPYIVSLLTRTGKEISEVYKSAYYANKKFIDYKNNPLKVLGV